MTQQKQKAFYEVGLHHCKITSQRYFMHQKKDTDEKMAVFEINFDVVQKINPTDNKVEEHSQKFPRQFQAYIKKSNFDICYEQITSILKHCGIKEPLTDFSKLDPDNPDHHNLVGKVLPMWCSRQDNGWERWQPSSEKKKGKPKEKQKNDPEAAEWLNSMFGSRVQNKAASMEETSDTERVDHETVPTPDTNDDEMPF